MKRWITLTIYLFSMMVMSSCVHNINKTPSQTENSVEQENRMADIRKKSESGLTFGIIYPVAHPFFEGATQHAKKTADKLGVELIIQAPDASVVEHQMKIMEAMISRNVDGIAIGPTDPAALTPFINKAMEAGINVICFDTDAPDSMRLSFIGTNNQAAGKHLGEVTAEALSYEGKIIISTGIDTMLNLNERIIAFQDIIEQYPQMDIIDIRSSDGTPAKTLANIEEMVEQHPDFDALVGVDSLSGPAGITVWKAKGLQKTLITFDDLPPVLEGISNHQVTSTISQSQFTWGDIIVEQLFDAHHKKKIPSYIYTETIEINKTNVEQYPLSSKEEE